ncbi:MAG TPA: hypothetical protein VNV62_09715 [Trebonia sp.]|nr:hypothetical protein [Trebonia sp.]
MLELDEVVEDGKPAHAAEAAALEAAFLELVVQRTASRWPA